jgi:hypothetical protein
MNYEGQACKTRLDLIVVEFNVKKDNDDNDILQRSKCTNTRRFTKEIKVKKSVTKCPSFIVKRRVKKQLEHYDYRPFRKVKGDVWNTPECLGVPCGCKPEISIKVFLKREQSNGILIHIWICILQAGAPTPSGANRIYLGGVV